ncbi:hypothetical protein LV89_01975 [Arcicella aurantiaca]|uniref:Uncharacterized protein n=1 Tax=Arcicella aurantiaca TaxID=591202 RepID=A0A316E9I5_9BACT|nr:hypothetical protein [Arcicella aurantiaca]PWK27160.1 hypothetical protein LV89_01975 [Arcicella aurantiaca]
MATIDRSPVKLNFKIISGSTIIQEFQFFDVTNPVAPVPFDIRNLNFRAIGVHKQSGSILPVAVFDANVVHGTEGVRNGLWLKKDTTNTMFLFYDWVTDSEQLVNAAEGDYEFTIWETDTLGVDACVSVLSYNCSKTNTVDAQTNQDGAIIVNCSTTQVTINVSIKIFN